MSYRHSVISPYLTDEERQYLEHYRARQLARLDACDEARAARRQALQEWRPSLNSIPVDDEFVELVQSHRDKSHD